LSLPTPIPSAYIMDSQVSALLDAVAADPFGPSCLSIVAPGGHGKSRLLQELGRVYRDAGVPVLNGVSALDTIDPDAVLLVDDVHLLGEAHLDVLRRCAGAVRPRLVVASRPWPRSSALAALTETLVRFRPTLLLSPFGPDQLAEYLTARLGVPPTPALVEFVRVQTGGMPRFVVWVADALAESRPVAHPGGSAGPVVPHLELPRAAVAWLRSELDRMDPPLQQFLLAAEAGMGLHLDLLGGLLHRDPHGVGEVIAAARSTGLLGPGGTLLPVAHRAVGAFSPAEHRVAVRQRLVELQRERGGSVLSLARSLLGTGAGGASMAAAFEAAADEALIAEPALAAELFAAAVAAGRPAAALAARWAQAAALAGDLDLALRLADRVIAVPDAPDRSMGALVAATALAHRGQLGRSAELFRWARAGTPAGSSAGSAGLLASIGLIGTGQLASAQQLLEAPTMDGPPTLLAGAASLMARGVHESVAGSTTAALSTLVRSSALLEPAGRAVLLPDSPAALTALVALHCGELSIAESALERAIAAGVGGGLMSARHRLLLGWIFMVRGETAAARRCLAAAVNPSPTTAPATPAPLDTGATGIGAGRALEPRDWLFAVALEVGLARRNSDLATLRRTWGHACEAIMRHSVDLFTLLPLGEFAVAAARLGDQDRLAPHLQEARALLGQLGDPPLWSTQLHWSGFHAAILAESPVVAEEHAAALAALSSQSWYCAAVSTAAQSWLAVLAGTIDPGMVEAAARGLYEAGLCWDGARLAGQAAIRTRDRKAMVTLLDCARVLQGRAPGQKDPAAANGDHPGALDRGRAEVRDVRKLSEREQEVAELVLAGMTYKQIGGRLFISAKTVEHHVARIRQRLGCTSRSDLLAKLRELSGPAGTD
jgi:DNA-binding CsgD family transcriptional regulator